MAIDRALHAVTWACWVAAALVVLSITRNPIYVGLTLLWIGLVWLAVGHAPSLRDLPAAPLSPLRFGLFVVVMSTLFNGLTVHAGRTVLFVIPGRVPLFSGPVTVEAVVYGVVNGLVLAGLFAAFMLLTRAVAVRDLIRLIRRAFYPVAVVISTPRSPSVPTTLQGFRQIQEAQAVRGHRMLELRSWLPLPALLISGMEAACNSRSHDGPGLRRRARGRRRHPVARRDAGGLIAGGDRLLLPRLAWQIRLTGGILLLFGVVLMALTLRQADRRRPHDLPAPPAPY
ncbi:MAG: hypothetical protein R3A10_11660 [Caldilineaceae bacterium]